RYLAALISASRQFHDRTQRSQRTQSNPGLLCGLRVPRQRRLVGTRSWPTWPSGSFDNLVGPQTPRADENASDAAIDHGAHRLQVRLESTRTDVVCVTVLAADDRALSTHFTCPGHSSMFLCFVPCPDIQRRNRGTR